MHIYHFLKKKNTSWIEALSERQVWVFWRHALLCCLGEFFFHWIWITAEWNEVNSFKVWHLWIASYIRDFSNFLRLKCFKIPIHSAINVLYYFLLFSIPRFFRKQAHPLSHIRPWDREKKVFALMQSLFFFFNNRHHKNSFWAKTPSVFMEEMGHDCLMLSPTALLACNHGGNCLCPIFSNQNHVGSGVSAVWLSSNRTLALMQKAEWVLLVTEHTAHRAVFTA